MGVSAIAAIVAGLAFLTVRWPGDTGRFVKVAFVGAVVALLGSASIAVLAAARDTYPGRSPSDDE